MPRLRPINFQNFNRDEAIRVIKDILMKYPRGPLQRQKKEEYASDYNDTYIKLFRTDGVSINRFGYTDEMAYKCVLEVFAGAKPTTWGIRDALLEIYPSWSAHKATRSANRVWQRFGDATRRHIATLDVEKLYVLEGMTPCAWIPSDDGDYRNDRRRRNALTRVKVAVTASNTPEAEMTASALFGHALNHLDVNTVVAWKSSDEGDAVVRNAAELNKLKRMREEIKLQMLDLQGKLDEMEIAEEAIKMYNVTIFSQD